MRRVEALAGDGVLPLGDLVEALDADDAERGRELVHAVVETRLRMVGLAVLAERARELDQLRVLRHEHSSLARRDRLRGSERPDARLAPRPGAAAVPRTAVRVGAVLDQDD